MTEQTREVFQCEDPAEAQVIRDEVLAPNGITGFIHDRSTHAFPTPATQVGNLFIAVELERATEARELIQDAIESGVISQNGRLLDGAG